MQTPAGSSQRRIASPRAAGRGVASSAGQKEAAPIRGGLFVLPTLCGEMGELLNQQRLAGGFSRGMSASVT
jgi:hypothetical protein